MKFVDLRHFVIDTMGIIDASEMVYRRGGVETTGISNNIPVIIQLCTDKGIVEIPVARAYFEVLGTDTMARFVLLAHEKSKIRRVK